jgi:hypothetical protein
MFYQSPRSRIAGRVIFLVVILAGLLGCLATAPAATPTALPAPDSPNMTIIPPTDTPTQVHSATPTVTHTATLTRTPTITPTATDTLTPTITPTPTFDFPDFTVRENQANCRYGPGTAYLYAAGLYAGDHAEVRGRNYSGTWLYLKPDTIDYFCWAAASVGEVVGEVFSVVVWQPNLPKTTFAGPPSGVTAARSGDQVTVSWNPVNFKPPEDGRGYLVEANVCQNGGLVAVAYHTEGSQLTLTDDPACGNSSGRVYAVEKHGYTDPVPIPWP